MRVHLSVSASQMIGYRSWMLEDEHQNEHQDSRILMMKMKSGLSGVLLVLLLLGCAASELGSVVRRYYHYINHHKTWTEAQHYCRSSTDYTDLATIFEQSDETQINMREYHAWIGLYKRTPDAEPPFWAWSNGESYGYNLTGLWGSGHPYGSHSCATVYYTHQRFYGHSCEGYFFFFCHKEKAHHNEYTFIPKSKTWSEAQQYCRDNGAYDDLASLQKYLDVYEIATQQNFPVWIGLHKEDGALKWSTGQSDYRNWAKNEPRDDGDCVSIYSTSKKMATLDCSARIPFVCLRDSLILVKENKTWEEALEYCRTRGQELLSVQPEDHDFVMDKVLEAETEEVWTALHFLGHQWLFVNGATVSYPDLPPCPLEGQSCGVLSKNSTGSMETLDCTEKRNFLCYK